jgi:hypothetical protein
VQFQLRRKLNEVTFAEMNHQRVEFQQVSRCTATAASSATAGNGRTRKPQQRNEYDFHEHIPDPDLITTGMKDC